MGRSFARRGGCGGAARSARWGGAGDELGLAPMEPRAGDKFGGRERSSIFGGRRQQFAKRDTEAVRMEELLEGGFCPFLVFLLYFYK